MYTNPITFRADVASSYPLSASKITESWSSLVGIVTAIVGNILISFALNTQRYAHIRIDREFSEGKERHKRNKRLPKSIRKYGAAVQQNEVAEERARLNAGASGPGHDEQDDDNSDGSQVNHSSSNKPEQDNEKPHSRKSYLRSPYWWVGIILMTIGEAGNFLAYGFAPASIVSPLGVVALISNCLIAPLILKEQFRKRDFWGVLIAIGGAVTVVLSAKTSEIKMGPGDLWMAIKRWEFLTYIGITCAVIIALMVASPRYGKRTVLIDLGLVGLFGGYTALSTKGVASMLSGSLWMALTFPITYALVAVLVMSAVMQIRYINRALSNFSSTQVIPTQFVLFTLSVIIGSAVLYRDFEKTDFDHVVKFIIGCALTFAGVWLITSGRNNDNGNDDFDDQDQTIQLIDEEAEMEDERTPLKHEHSSRIVNDDTQRPVHKPSVDTMTSHQQSVSLFAPSVAVTPYDDNLNQNPWVSSTDHLDKLERPRTPPNSRPLLDMDDAPFFTPGSGPDTATTVRAGVLNRTNSSPTNPQTPSRAQRAESPSKADLTTLAPGEAYQTPRSNLLRSARGSMSRLIPGPFLGPLSSASLNTVVAESLLKGEGSPQGPVRSRSYGRKSRPAVTPRTERVRRESATGTSAAEGADLESGLTTPMLSRWQTQESILENPGQRSARNLGGVGGESSTASAIASKRPGLLPSLSPSFQRFVSKMKDRRDSSGKEPERDLFGAEEHGEATNSDHDATKV